MEEHGVDLNTIQKRYEGKSYDIYMKGYLSTLDPVFLLECGLVQSQAALLASTKGGGNVVELAVGSGRNLASGFYSRQNLSVLGLDVTDGMLVEAKRKVQELQLSNVQLEKGDVRDALSKTGKNYSDLTVITYALCVTPEPEVVLRGIIDITKSGGLILIMDYVFAQNFKIQKDQEEMAPLTKTQGVRLYESKYHLPADVKQVTDYNGVPIANGPDKEGHSIVWDPTFDLRALIRSEFAGKVEAIRQLESEKDSIQSNMLFLGRKL